MSVSSFSSSPAWNGLPAVHWYIPWKSERRDATFLLTAVLVTSFNAGRSRVFLPKFVEREGPTPAPEPSTVVPVTGLADRTLVKATELLESMWHRGIEKGL